MSKKSGFLCAALLAVMLAGAGIAGCGPVSAGGSDSVSTGGSDSVGTGSESASEDKAPVLRMNAPAMAVPCGKPAELPEATATDEEDGDLTERICVEVTDTATGERVYPGRGRGGGYFAEGRRMDPRGCGGIYGDVFRVRFVGKHRGGKL